MPGETRPIPTPSTMRAVVQDRYGSHDVLTTAVINTSVLGERDELLRAHAAGLDRGN